MVMRLVQPAGDSSIRRLVGEAKWNSERTQNGGDTYSLRHAGAQTGDLIVDVGSNIGDFTIAAATLFPWSLVVGIEANPVAYFYTRWNLYLNGIDAHASLAGRRSGVVTLHGAVGTSAMRVFAPPMDSLNSIAVPERDTDSGAARVQGLRKRFHSGTWYSVAAIDLPRVLHQHGVSQVRFLKMDCEGCEYALLPQWWSVGFLNRVRLLTAETHARYEPNGTFSAESMLALDAALFARGCTRSARPRSEFNFPC